VAAVAGGAGGYQWAKRKSKDSMKKHSSQSKDGNGHVDACSQRATLKRLKYLVKWGHWQLLEYQGGDPELRAAVIDEVVRPFSPWVQHLYVQLHKGNHYEVQEVSAHLALLCQMLQRRTAFEAVLQSAKTVSEAAEQGVMDAGHVERCRIVFPTLLEAARLYEKLSLGEGLYEKFALGEVPQRDATSTRLKISEVAVREVLQRSDVQDVLQGRKRPFSPTQSKSSEEPVVREDTVCSNESGEQSRHVALEVPPEGAEDEAGTISENELEDEEIDYYSCSDDEAAGEETAKPPTSPIAARKAELAGYRTFRRRLEEFPRGEGAPGAPSWSPFDESLFDLRGESYLRDRRKTPAGPSMLELLSVDIFRISPLGPVTRAAEHYDLLPAQHWRSGDTRFLFIQNWIFPPFQAVIVGALDPKAAWLTQDTPQRRAWERFLAMSNQERRNAFKVIMSVEQGPWLVKRAVPKKPVLVGRQLKMETTHEPDRFLEIVVDVSGGKTEQMATGMVMRAAKSLQLAMTTLIEATHEDELPEVPLLCAAMMNLDTSAVCCHTP